VILRIGSNQLAFEELPVEKAWATYQNPVYVKEIRASLLYKTTYREHFKMG